MTMSTTSKLLLGVALIAGAYAGSSWYMGSKAEPEIQRQVAKVNEAVATQYGVNFNEGSALLKVVSYQRGVFSSTINYELVVNDEGEQYQLLFEDHLRHGPFPFQALSKGQLSPILAYSELRLLPSQNVQPWFDMTKGLTPITANSVIELNGSSKSQINLAAVDYTEDDGSHFRLEAAMANVDYRTANEQVFFNAHFPRLSLIDKDEDINVQLNDLLFKGDLSDTDSVQRSDAELHIKQFGVKVEDIQVWFDNTSAKSSYTLANNLLDSALAYQIEQIRFDEQALGKVTIAAEVKRLDYESLTVLAQSDDVDELSEAELQPILQKFLSHQPELRINTFDWENAAGKSGLSADLQLAKTAANDYEQNELDLAHFFDVLDVDINLSRKMLQGFFKEEDFTSSLVDMLFTQFAEKGQEAGLLVYNGNNAELKLHFDAAKNQLVLNGKPASPDQLLQAFLALQMSGDLF